MKEIKAIDINLQKAESKGVAYYRITPEMRDFLSKCFEQSIIGFEYEEGELNFGVILGK